MLERVTLPFVLRKMVLGLLVSNHMRVLLLQAQLSALKFTENVCFFFVLTSDNTTDILTLLRRFPAVIHCNSRFVLRI